MKSSKYPPEGENVTQILRQLEEVANTKRKQLVKDFDNFLKDALDETISSFRQLLEKKGEVKEKARTKRIPESKKVKEAKVTIDHIREVLSTDTVTGNKNILFYNVDNETLQSVNTANRRGFVTFSGEYNGFTYNVAGNPEGELGNVIAKFKLLGVKLLPVTPKKTTKRAAKEVSKGKPSASTKSSEEFKKVGKELPSVVEKQKAQEHPEDICIDKEVEENAKKVLEKANATLMSLLSKLGDEYDEKKEVKLSSKTSGEVREIDLEDVPKENISSFEDILSEGDLFPESKQVDISIAKGKSPVSTKTLEEELEAALLEDQKLPVGGDDEDLWKEFEEEEKLSASILKTMEEEAKAEKKSEDEILKGITLAEKDEILIKKSNPNPFSEDSTLEQSRQGKRMSTKESRDPRSSSSTKRREEDKEEYLQYPTDFLRIYSFLKDNDMFFEGLGAHDIKIISKETKTPEELIKLFRRRYKDYIKQYKDHVNEIDIKVNLRKQLDGK